MEIEVNIKKGSEPLEFSSEHKFTLRWLLLTVAVACSASIGRFLLRVMENVARMIEMNLQ